MDFKQYYHTLFQECKELLLEPQKFWSKDNCEIGRDKVVPFLFVPLVILTGVAVFLGEIISSPEILFSYAIMKAMREIVSYLLQFYIAIPVLTALLKNFGGTQEKEIIRFVLACSMVPFLVASFITGLFPGLYILSILGLYGFYLFVKGTQSCFKLPAENLWRYTILAILMIILIFGMINVISWKFLLVIFPYGA